jgi:hypothetical protein
MTVRDLKLMCSQFDDDALVVIDHPNGNGQLRKLKIASAIRVKSDRSGFLHQAFVDGDGAPAMKLVNL